MRHHRIIRIPTCVCPKHAQATNCTNPNNINIQSIIDTIDLPKMQKNHSHQSQQYVVTEQILDMIWMMTI